MSRSFCCGSALCCAMASFIASVPCLFLVGYTAAWHARMDPVFMPMHCKEKGNPAKEIGYDFWPLPGIVNVRETFTYECHNRNPYLLQVMEGSGKFLLWSTMTEIGRVVIPPTNMERDGEGELILDCFINLKGLNQAKETMALLQGPQDVVQNMTIVTQLKIPFLFFELTQMKTMHQICGKKINILTQQESMLNCADSLAELKIYDFDADATLFEVKTTEPVEKESTQTRDVASVGIIVVSLVVSIALITYGSFAAWCAFTKKATLGKSVEDSSRAEETAETDTVDTELTA